MRRLIGVMLLLVCVGWVGRAHAELGPRLESIGPDGGRDPLPMVGSDLQVTVRGAIAQVRHRQAFFNPATTPIEAIYVFPLHERAAVGGMTMRIGARTITAVIQRRSEARATYDAARAAGKTAALLTQERPNVFTQSVAGILPGETIDIELTYDILLAPEHGWYELALPTVVGPRYVPGAALAGPPTGTGAVGDTDRVPDASRITPAATAPGAPPHTGFGFGMDLDAGVPVTEVDCPTHALLGTDLGASHLTLELAHPQEVADRDVVVRWQTEVARPTATVVAGRGPGGGFVAATIVPPPLTSTGRRPRREIVFVLDTSGSMSGAPMALVRAGIDYALDRLETGDTFRIINFSTSVAGFEGGTAHPADRATVARAHAFVRTLGDGGGTEMLGGVRAALDDPPTDGRRRYVFFMTDGFIGNDDEIIAAIDRLRQPSTYLFAFGVGSSVNRALLDQMARAGHGTAQVLLLDDPPAPQVARFFSQLAAPMWADVKVTFDGLAVTDLTPATPGDLFLGQPLVVAGRYHAGGVGRLRITATVDGQPVALEQPVTLPQAGDDAALVGRLWARTKIRELSYGKHGGLGGDAAERITEIALAHALVSPGTAFVAVDDVVRTTGAAATRAVPVQTPAGVDPANSPVVGATAAGQGVTITQDYTSAIPVPGRTFESVLSVVPGSQADGAGESFSGSSSLEEVYIVDGDDTGETIQIVDSPPMIDPGSMSLGVTIDRDYVQNLPMPGRSFASALGAAAGYEERPHHASGRAAAELLARGGASLDGRQVGALGLALGLGLTPNYQLGVSAELAWRADQPTHVGLMGLLTRWGLWRRLALRLGLGADGPLPAPTALAWRAELLHPLGRWGRALPMVSVGVSDVRGDGHAPAPTVGLGLRF
ncbi:MAG: VIT and VWA domain-containing protein [Kofleriaceae bacterium]